MFRIKLQGGALYVSIIIAILISIILSLFIVVAHFNTQSIQEANSIQQLQLSLESGFEIAQSMYAEEHSMNQWQKAPYNNDSIAFNKIPWGCYSIHSVRAKNAHHTLQQVGLFGVYASKDTGLFVSDQQQAIGLAGKMAFKSNCYLPKADVKPAYIDGVSFSDISSLKPFIKVSSKIAPSISKEYQHYIRKQQTDLNPLNDSLVSVIPQELHQSFYHRTAVLQQENIELQNTRLYGNIKLYANSISVNANCDLQHVLLIARKIIFKKGFKGIVHAIATDSILIEDGCEFEYPSSLCLFPLPTNTTVPSAQERMTRGVFINGHSIFKGAILAMQEEESSRLIVKTASPFELVGNLYCAGYLQAHGNFYGSVYCKSLVVQTALGVYENHLMNCLIDSRKFNKQLVVPNWFGNNVNDECAKWF